MRVGAATIKQMQFVRLGELILETNQLAAMYTNNPDGNHLPIGEGLYDAMMCGDFEQFLGVVRSEEGLANTTSV
jgi:hypothetical protein